MKKIYFRLRLEFGKDNENLLIMFQNNSDFQISVEYFPYGDVKYVAV
jgi:hypothetical protein